MEVLPLPQVAMEDPEDADDQASDQGDVGSRRGMIWPYGFSNLRVF